MKTSKKLLSLFLAIVMVVTSCSVGLTAFAADQNKTDKNNSYWHDGTDADAAFESLNDLVDAYVPQLLNIPKIKSLLEDKLGMTVTDTTTISDVVAGASPMLLNALSSSSSNIESVMGFGNNGGHQDNSTLYDSKDALQELLTTYLNDDDAAMNFFALYSFCNDNYGANGELGDYCKQTLPKLRELRNRFWEIESKDSENYDNAIGFASMIFYGDEDSDLSELSLEGLENYEYEGTKLKDINTDEANYFITYVQAFFDISKSNTTKVSNFGQALYYSFGAGAAEFNYAMYQGFAELGGEENFPALEDWDFNMGAEDNEYYYAQSVGLLIYSSLYTLDDIKAKEITDAQLEQYVRDNMGKQFTTEDYVKYFNESSPFSAEFTSYIVNNVSRLSAFINPAFAYDSSLSDDENVAKNVAALKAARSSNSASNFDGMTFIEELNYMLPSLIAKSHITDKESDLSGSIDVRVLASSYLIKYNYFMKPALSKYQFDYNNYALPDSLVVEATNAVLNSTIKNLFDESTPTGSIVAPVVSALFESNVTLYAADGSGVLNDIWKNLYNAPVETIFNLLPTVVIALDELVLPLVFNGEGDSYNAVGGSPVLYSLLCNNDTSILHKYTQAVGSDIGIGALTFDLNKVIPAILHWLTGDEDTAYDLVGYYTEAPYNQEDGQTIYVPKFTNIYVADKAIYGAKIGTGSVKVPGLARTIYKALSDGKTNKDEIAAAKRNALGIDEMVTELATFAMESVDEYVDAHGNDIRYNGDLSADPTVTQKGLNNIFVALPQVLDIMGKKFIAKYDVDSNWTYTYSGKMTTITKTFRDDKEVSQLQNKTLQGFKDLATVNDPSKVLESFVNILIGNWLNAGLDLVNDVTKDKNNKISSNLPLIQALLSALGGLGPQSVITDVLNGLFQLKRSDDASFTLQERDETGFVGFSNESGFFLLSNIQFTKDGESKGLVPVIMTLIKGNGKADDYNTGNAFKSQSVSPLLTSSKSKKSAAGTVYSELLTKDNEAAAQDLIDALDALLSSLLSNTSLNGFDWDATDNILASIATFFSAYLGSQNTNDIVKLVNNYLYYIVGENNATKASSGKIGTKPTADGDVDASKVYTSANLSNLVIQTYSLVENIVDYLFYNSETGFLYTRDPNMLLSDAVAGLISPDAVAVRMSDKYSKTKKILAKDDYHNWNSFKVLINAANAKNGKYQKDYLKYGFANGDKDSFYEALGESLSGVAGILSAVLTASYTDSNKSGNLYSAVVYPVLNSVAEATGASGVMSPAAFNKASASEQLIKGILTPISALLDTVYDTPVSTLLNLVKGLAGVVNDTSLKAIINGALGSVNTAIGGVGNVVGFLSPTFAKVVKDLLGKNGLTYSSLGLPSKNIIVTLINNALGGLITLPAIDWDKLAAAKSPAQVLLLAYGYIVDTVLNSDVIKALIDSFAPQLTAILKNLSAAEILAIVKDVLASIQNPTDVYWTFKYYSTKLSSSFKYPNGITQSDATKAVSDIDNLVANIFPLLNSLGVTDIEGLEQLVNDNLYKNELLTKLATTLYGALDGNDTVATVLAQIGIEVSPAGVAKYLTNSKYGATYSSAASTLKKAKSWSDVKSLNWGFTDGSANAKQGFVNGLAAVLRPLNDVLAIFLADGSLDLTPINLKKIVNQVNLSGSQQLGKGEMGCKLTYSLKNSVLKLTFNSNAKGNNNKATVPSVLEVDLNEIIDSLDKAIDKNGKLHLGTNGYESAIIPLLEAFMCKNVKTYSQYKSDYNKAKDNLLINVLNPIVGLVDDILAAPVDTVSKILPNVAYFIDNNGLGQMVGNLLAPITADDGLLGALAEHGVDVDELITAIAGKSLGTIVTDALNIKTKLTLNLRSLETCNVQDIVVPLVNSLLKSKGIGIVISDIDFGKLASLGTLNTVSSAAKNANGQYLTKQVKANQGQVLVTFLRYVSSLLINNSTALSKLICGIDAVKKNDTIVNVIKAVFNQIGIAAPDEIVIALFYFFNEETSNVFFDYSNFTYDDSYEFSFGTMDEDFCRQLAPMLDGLVSGLLEGGLLGMIEGLAYKDSVISSIATGLYSAIEGVNINDSTTLTSLLAQTNIDFSTTNVANLLVDEAYGQQYAAAASVIKSAGSWKNVNADSLVWGVKDRDSFLHALVAVLRPVYGVLDVLLNDASLNVFNLINIPGSDGYSSTIVPLLEAFQCYNIKTQYQYREDIFNEYDNILLDILNPLWDKVEDLLLAPIETLADILPNLSLFFANDGLLQVIDNLLEAVSSLIDAVKPVANVNDILLAVGLDVPGLLKKIGINIDLDFDIYDLKKTLTPLLGADNVVSLLNQILGIIDIKGTKLGIVLPEIDWFQLASHGEVIVDQASQVATIGKRIYVKADQDETLIAVLRFLISTINYQDNYDAIVSLISGLLGDGVEDSVSDMIDQVLGMLKGDPDKVIADLVELLQSFA